MNIGTASKPRWTEDRTERLKELWQKGESALTIALDIGDGMTRNGIIGKVHRLKLQTHGRNPPKAARGKSVKAVRPKRGRGQKKMPAIRAHLDVRTRLESGELTPAPIRFVVDSDIVGVPLVELSNHTCRWPLWGEDRPVEYRYCGAEPAAGSVYCETHRCRAEGRRL